jgi:hypothetical protein
MLTEAERRTLSDVAAAGGLELDERDWDLLASAAHLVPTLEDAALLESRRDLAMRIMERRERWDAILLGLTRGVFHLAAAGHEFAAIEEVERRLGAPLDKLHRKAGASFRAFAKTYATLGVWTATRPPDDPEKELMGRRALREIELGLATLFFPDPDEDATDPAQREEAQRRILAHYDAPLDVDEFMRGNSVLIRARRAQRPNLLGRLKALLWGLVGRDA